MALPSPGWAAWRFWIGSRLDVALFGKVKAVVFGAAQRAAKDSQRPMAHRAAQPGRTGGVHGCAPSGAGASGCASASPSTGAVTPPCAAMYSSKLANFCLGGRRVMSSSPGSSSPAGRRGLPPRRAGRGVSAAAVRGAAFGRLRRGLPGAVFSRLPGRRSRFGAVAAAAAAACAGSALPRGRGALAGLGLRRGGFAVVLRAAALAAARTAAATAGSPIRWPVWPGSQASGSALRFLLQRLWGQGPPSHKAAALVVISFFLGMAHAERLARQHAAQHNAAEQVRLVKRRAAAARRPGGRGRPPARGRRPRRGYSRRASRVRPAAFRPKSVRSCRRSAVSVAPDRASACSYPAPASVKRCAPCAPAVMPLCAAQAARRAASAAGCAPNTTRWIGSISMAGLCTLQTSARQ